MTSTTTRTADLVLEGGGVKGIALVGAATALDEAGNPKHTLDFRAVYGTLIEKWLEFDSAALLGERFEDVGFL